MGRSSLAPRLFPHGLSNPSVAAWEGRSSDGCLSEYMTVPKEAIVTQDEGRLLQGWETEQSLEFGQSRKVLMLAAPGLALQEGNAN